MPRAFFAAVLARPLGLFAAAVFVAACFSPPAPAGSDAGECVADSQRCYEYPGCANEDYGCPRLKTFYCAAEAIRVAHAACTSGLDCAAVRIDSDCTGYGECPPAAIARAELAPFTSAMTAEVRKYCANARCATAGVCALDMRHSAAVCSGGRCETSFPDVQSGAACADSDAGACIARCAPGSFCFTQVSCAPSDGGWACTRPVPSAGDDRCRLACGPDAGFSGCPYGQVCRHVRFFGCDTDDGSPEGKGICCDVDGGCP